MRAKEKTEAKTRRCCYAMLWIILVLVTFNTGYAEVSSNLHRQETVGKKSRRVEEAWWENDEGTRVFAEDLGWASVRYEYNKKPRCIRESYYDLDGNLCVIRDGYAVVQQKWDGNGRLLWRAYFDEKENPVIGPEGYHKRENKYDHLKLDSTINYGTDGELLRSDSLWAVLQYTYNSKRQCLKAEYFNADRLPMNGPGGFAVMERAYVKTEMSSDYFYDEKGNMVYNSARGYAGYLQTYEDNRLARVEYFGADGKLMMYKGRYAYIENEYEKSRKNPARVHYFDQEGNPAIQPGGWASVGYTYDAKGRADTVTYYNESDERTTTSEGISKIQRTYAKTGDISREAYYDIDDRLMLHPEKGYAIVTRRIQSKGIYRYEEYFDEEKNPMNLQGGYHGISYKWKKGRKISETFIDFDRKPVNGIDGYATVMYEYDEDGNNIAREYLNAEGEPVDGGKGYYRCEITYYHEKPRSYQYYGVDGTATNGPEGVHELQYKYDEHSAVAEISCFGNEGEAVLCKNGWHRYAQRRDDAGRVVEKSYFDTEGYLVVGQDGWAGQTTAYNDRGKVLMRSTYGIDGNPAPAGDTYATVFYQYNEETGILEAVFYFDGQGQSVRCENGYNGVWYLRNDQGTVIGERYVDENTEIMMIEKGYAGTDYEYNEEGRVAKITYVNLAGQPVEIGIGYCAVEMDYDENGKVVMQHFMNLRGEEVYARDVTENR